MHTLERQTRLFNGQGKSHQKDRQQFQHSALGNSQQVRARFGHFQPNHTQVHYKLKPTMRPQTCQTKKINKCSNDKLCLMTTPLFDRQRAEINRRKVHACMKHPMLIFTSITVNKNNSYNSI